MIRHAEAEGNLYKIAHGQYNSFLTVKGKCQCRCLTERFSSMQFDAVYTSDLRRAVCTAQVLPLRPGAKLRLCSDLREMYYGDWEGQPWGQIRKDCEESMEQFLEDICLWNPPHGESYKAVQDRMYRAIMQIVQNEAGRELAVVSHNIAIRSFLDRLVELDCIEAGKPASSDNTAVSLLCFDDSCIRVLYRADTSHLPEALRFRPRPKTAPLLYYERESFFSGDKKGVWLKGMCTEEPLAESIVLFEGASATLVSMTVLGQFTHARFIRTQMIGQLIAMARAAGMTKLTVAQGVQADVGEELWNTCGFEHNSDGILEKDLWI